MPEDRHSRKVKHQHNKQKKKHSMQEKHNHMKHRTENQHHKIPHVMTGGKHDNKEVIIPQFQQHFSDNRQFFETLPFHESYASSGFGGSSDVTTHVNINRASHSNIKHMAIRFKITVATGSGYLVPASFMLKNPSYFRGKSGSGAIIQNVIPTDLFLKNGMFNNEIKETIETEQGYSLTTHWQNHNYQIHNGDVIYRYVWINFPFWGGSDSLDMQHLDEDIQLYLTLPNTIVSSGTSTLTLNNVDLMLISEKEHHSLEMTKEVYNKHVVCQQYLECIEIEKAQTMAPSGTYYLDLDPLDGRLCAFLIAVIRADTTTYTSQNLIRFYGVGATGSLNVERKSGQGIFSTGSDVYQDVFARLWAQNFPSNFGAVKNAYLFPFCENCSEALMGKVSGGFFFDSTNYRLKVNTSAAVTASVHTITCTSAANDGGAFQLGWRGSVTNNQAFNETAANIKTDFEAMDSFIDQEDVTAVTLAGALTTTRTLTWTSSKPVRDLVTVIPSSIADGGVYDLITPAVSTGGTYGFPASATKTISVYAYCYKKNLINNGKIHSEFLGH